MPRKHRLLARRRATARSDYPEDRLPDLPALIKALEDNSIKVDFPLDLAALLKEIERRYINRALVKENYCVSRAARLLGLKRTTLVEKFRRR